MRGWRGGEGGWGEEVGGGGEDGGVEKEKVEREGEGVDDEGAECAPPSLSSIQCTYFITYNSTSDGYKNCYIVGVCRTTKGRARKKNTFLTDRSAKALTPPPSC